MVRIFFSDKKAMYLPFGLILGQTLTRPPIFSSMVSLPGGLSYELETVFEKLRRILFCQKLDRLSKGTAQHAVAGHLHTVKGRRHKKGLDFFVAKQSAKKRPEGLAVTIGKILWIVHFF